MDNTETVKEKKKLPARKIVLIVIMSIIMAATLAFAAFIAISLIYSVNIKSDEPNLAIFAMPVMVGLLIIEGTQFFDFFYFFLDNDKKKKYKTVLNTITLSASLVEALLIVLGVLFLALDVSAPTIFFVRAAVCGLLAAVPAIVLIKIAYLIAHLIGKNKEAPVV